MNEYTLLDFMANGSSVAKLVFDLALVKLLKRNNADTLSVLRAEHDAEDRAMIVRSRVYNHAFKSLRAWRKT